HEEREDRRELLVGQVSGVHGLRPESYRKCARRPKPVAWHPRSPFEGSRRSLAAAAPSPTRRPPLLGSAALQSVVCDEVSGCLGYLIPPRRSSFPTRPRGFSCVAVPQRFHIGIILSCPPRPPRLSRAPARPAEPGTSRGLSSLIAT